MNKPIFVAACSFFAIVAPVPAAVGYFGNFYVVIDAGSGNQFFQTTDANQLGSAGGGFNTASDGVNPGFSGANLGTFNPTIDTLTLNGFEMNTFNDSGDSVNDATLAYRIYSGAPSGSESFLTVNSPISNIGNDKTWQTTTQGVDLLNSLGDGTYTLEVHVVNAASFTGGTFTMSNWQTSGRPTATFTVVPESSVILLGGLGMLGILRRRR